jgi:hypothetical protein
MTRSKEEIDKIPIANMPVFGENSSCMVKARVFKAKELRDNQLQYANRKKRYSVAWLTEILPEVVNRILAGETFTIEKFKKMDYFKYLVSRLNPAVQTDLVPNKKGLPHVWKKFTDLQRLCKSIRDNGLMAPIDMYMNGSQPIVTRGTRRIEILYQLKRSNIPVRVWRNEWLGRQFIPSASWPNMDMRIHGAAVNQFVRLGHKATDKYWVHNYTPYYDWHTRGLSGEIKILELGVKDGMSLYLWEEAFPKAQIYGLDLKKKMEDKGRIKVIEGDERDSALLNDIGKKYGPFDLIIDDASHLPNDQRNTFNVLWKYIKKGHNNKFGGTYAIEDIYYSWHPKFAKNSEPITKVINPYIDLIHTTNEVRSVAYYPHICFIEKA